MHTGKYHVAAFALMLTLTLSGQAFAGNQRDYSTTKNGNSPLLSYTGNSTSNSTSGKQDHASQYDPRLQDNANYGSRFQAERCEVLKNNSKALQRTGCM